MLGDSTCTNRQHQNRGRQNRRCTGKLFIWLRRFRQTSPNICGSFPPPRRQSLPLVGFLRLIFSIIYSAYFPNPETTEAGKRSPRPFFGGRKFQDVSIGVIRSDAKPLDFQHPSHQVSSVFRHEFALFRFHGFQCL